MIKISKSLREIAQILGAEVYGDQNCVIHNVAPLEFAMPGSLSFLAETKFRKLIKDTRASAVLLTKNDLSYCKGNALVVDNVRLSLAQILHVFYPQPETTIGIHPTAVIGANCKIASDVSIGPHCVLGDEITLESKVVIEAGSVLGARTKIGANTHLKANVTAYHDVMIGADCLIHSGTVLGSDGFGFANHEGQWIKIPHVGSVEIKDKVEIGANTCVDRGVFGNTYIGNGVIIDNLVQIAHNVYIGDNTAIAGCVAVAGSTRIGKNCMIGGGSSIAGHLTISDKVCITATSGVNHSLKKPGFYSSGFPAKPSTQWRKNVARFNYLDSMAKRLKEIERNIVSNPNREIED